MEHTTVTGTLIIIAVFLVAGFFFIAIVLSILAKTMKSIRTINNTVTSWRGIEYRKSR